MQACPVGYKVCGRDCIANSATCVSAGSRRDLRRKPRLVPWSLDWSRVAEFRCEGRLTACAVPSSQFFNGDNFECIDTQSDIESCGACAFPLPGQPFGVDCTALPGTAEVGCVQGSCNISACLHGYELSEDGRACVRAEPQWGFVKQERRRFSAGNPRMVRALPASH